MLYQYHMLVSLIKWEVEIHALIAQCVFTEIVLSKFCQCPINEFKPVHMILVLIW